MITGSEKLKLVRELGVIRGSLQAAEGRNKLVLVKRIGEIRKLLLSAKGNNAAELVVDANDKAGSYRAITGYIKSHVASLPEDLSFAELSTVKMLKGLIDKNPVINDETNQAYSELVEAIDGIRRNFSVNFDKKRIGVFEHFRKAGDSFGADIEVTKTLLADVESVKNEPISIPVELSAQLDELSAAMKSLKEEYSKATDQRVQMSKDRGTDLFDQSQYERLGDEQTRLYKLYEEARLKFIDIDRQPAESKQKKIENLQAGLAIPGERILSSMSAASAVSQAQADEWASKQVIDKSVVTKIGRKGYKEAEIRRDMAEFYRLTGGKLRNIALVSTSPRRASAGNIGDFEGSSVNVSGNFDKRVLFHELAHHLESDPAAVMAANGFLLKRRESETVYSLKSLTGNPGYRSDEGAYKDSFIDPYIGKVYSNGWTEVFAMGVQEFRDPISTAQFFAKDPEMAAMIAGYLQMPLSPAMIAMQKAQDQMAGKSQDYRDEVADRYMLAINRLAEGVSIVDDGWLDAMTEEEQDFFRTYALSSDPKAKFVGSSGAIRVFQGKFKSNVTKRLSKGYALVSDKRISLKTDRGMMYQNPAYLHGSIEEIKAAIKMAIELYDGDIYHVSWRVFGKNMTQINIINQANRILKEQV